MKKKILARRTGCFGFTPKIRDDYGFRQRRPAGKNQNPRQFGYFYLWRLRCHFFQRFLRLVDAQETISPKLNINSVGQVKVFTKAVNLLIRMIKGKRKRRTLEPSEEFIFCYFFRPRRISLGRKKENLTKEDLKDLNKIHSGYFENSAIWRKRRLPERA